MTLLEKAKAVPKGLHKIQRNDPEKIELAIAFARGHVSRSQICTALNMSKGSVDHMLSRCIQEAVIEGRFMFVK